MAVLAVRNEQFAIYNCLRHLMRNGIDFAIVDNGSTDATRSIIESTQFKSSLRDIQTVPFDGVFDWEQLLIAQEKLIREHEADWVILLGADEIMHSYRAGETLSEAIERLDLRHYVFRDQQHAFHKYPSRVYAPKALARGWSIEMHGKPAEAFAFPDAAELEFLLNPSSTDLNRSRPRLKPYWLWDHRTAGGQISEDRRQMTEH
jgi:hypothetical protein